MKHRNKKHTIKKGLLNFLKILFAILPIIVFIYAYFYYKKFDSAIIAHSSMSDQRPQLQDSADVWIANNDLIKLEIVKNDWFPVRGIVRHQIGIRNDLDVEISEVHLAFTYYSDKKKLQILDSKVLKMKELIPSNETFLKEDVQVGFVRGEVMDCNIAVIAAKLSGK